MPRPQKRSGPVRSMPAVIAVVFVVAVIIGGGVAAGRTYLLRTQSKTFVDSTVTAVASTWNLDQILQHATPKARAALKPEDLRVLANGAARLGAFGAYLGATVTVPVSYWAGLGGSPSAIYVARARYVDGLATFQVGVVKQDGHWAVDAFGAQINLLGDPDSDLLGKLLPDDQSHSLR